MALLDRNHYRRLVGNHILVWVLGMAKLKKQAARNQNHQS